MATAPAWLVPTLIGAGILGTVGAIAWAMSEPEPRGGVRNNPSLLAAEAARRSAPKRYCPSGSRIVSVLAPRRTFTTAQAKALARRAGVPSSKVMVTDRYIHVGAGRGGYARVRTIPLGHTGALARVAWKRC